MEDFDLINALDAKVYKLDTTNLNININDLIVKINNGFSKLICTQPECNQKAIMYIKNLGDTSTKVYWEEHTKLYENNSNHFQNLEDELKRNILILKNLEKKLIILEVQMEYIRDKDAGKYYSKYDELIEEIFKEYKSREETLSKIIQKAELINKLDIMINKDEQYESLLFVEQDSNKWEEHVLSILNMICDIRMNTETNQLLYNILELDKRAKKSEKEPKKYELNYIPEELYEKTFELCRFPTQVVDKIKEMELKMKSMAKEVIEYKKVIKIMIFSANFGD